MARGRWRLPGTTRLALGGIGSSCSALGGVRDALQWNEVSGAVNRSSRKQMRASLSRLHLTLSN
jgi:hypothetical protein